MYISIMSQIILILVVWRRVITVFIMVTSETGNIILRIIAVHKQFRLKIRRVIVNPFFLFYNLYIIRQKSGKGKILCRYLYHIHQKMSK